MLGEVRFINHTYYYGYIRLIGSDEEIEGYFNDDATSPDLIDEIWARDIVEFKPIKKNSKNKVYCEITRIIKKAPMDNRSYKRGW